MTLMEIFQSAPVHAGSCPWESGQMYKSAPSLNYLAFLMYLDACFVHRYCSVFHGKKSSLLAQSENMCHNDGR